MIDEDLLAAAATAATHSYSPYSQFPVGAALLLDDGRVITGCNVENASYGLCQCAERSAITRMIIESDGVPQVRAVAIVGLKAEPCWPCGACRQVLREFNCERVIVSSEGAPVSLDFAELLPNSFGPEHL